MRIYEKGKQLGDPTSPWVRFEVQLRDKDREIPFDVLLTPGRYLAGSYPCMSWVSQEIERIRTIQETARIGYEALARSAKTSYGPLIDTMLKVEGSAEAVVEKLRRPGIPRRLDLPDIPVNEGRQ